MNEHFVDLRREHLSSESFWPSFTDIMMVVVMIFLLTSTILMVRNWELLDQLRTSMAAEEQASRIIHDTSEENATLEEQLSQAQNEISLLRMQILLANEQQNQLKLALEDQQQKSIIILNENADLKTSLDRSETRIVDLRGEVDKLNEELSQLSIDLAEKDKALDAERKKIIVITRKHESDSRKLTALQDDYGSLKVKYDKLIRPARTTKGKYVVSVNYERVNDKERIRFKDSGETKYRTVSEKKLHLLLAALKAKHPEKLYIKIVIPKDSGLTYNEAWSFMKDLLDKYDYYSQESKTAAPSGE